MARAGEEEGGHFREMADQLRPYRTREQYYTRLDNWKQGQGTTIK